MNLLIVTILGIFVQTMAHPEASTPRQKTVALKSRQAVDILVRETREADSPFEISFVAFDKPVNLRLQRPDESIFTDGFTFGTSTVYKKELAPVEEHIYVDKANKAALKVHMPSGGNSHQVNGFVNGMGIVHEAGQHYVTLSEHHHHKNWCGVKHDSVYASIGGQHEILDHNSNPRENVTQSQTAILEVQLVFDTVLAGELGDQANLTTYAAVMLHAVNTIFADLSNPSVQAKLAGVYTLTEDENQRLVNDPNNDINDMIEILRTWVNESPTGLGPSDTVALLTGMVTLDRDNDNGPGTLGIAYTGAICGRSKVSVNQDVGAAWASVFTLTHELGHQLGSPHDFEPGNLCQEQGYIMGYRPGSLNYFHFSECSKASIRSVLQSSGQCVYTNDAGNGIGLGSKDPGQDPAMTFAFQCNKMAAWMPSLRDVELVYDVNDNPAEQACYETVCSLPPNYVKQTFKLGPPDEGTSCNQSGGKCHLGRCQ